MYQIYFILEWNSTCFGRSFRPSSVPQNRTYSNRHLSNRYCCESYVYWTVHRIDSWIKRDQLDITCFIISLFNAQHVSDVNTSILRRLRLIFWVISWVVLLCKDRGYCTPTFHMNRPVVPQLAYGYHTTTAKPQRNTNTHRTRYV